jgi:hypothetical protein
MMSNMKKTVVDTLGMPINTIDDGLNTRWLERKGKKVMGIMQGVMKEFRDDKKGDGGCHAWWDQQWDLKVIDHP